MSTTKVLEILKKVDELPTLPHIVTKIVELANSPGSTAEQINNLIRQDQVLAAKTLKLVNSAFYGYSRQIKRITEAVVILGFNVVKNLALSVSVCDMFKSKGKDEFQLGQLWKHSVAVAVCNTIIAKRIKLIDPEEVFIMGLLHDIGIVMEHQFLNEEFRLVLAIVEKETILLQDAERRILGLDHALIGKKIIEKWKLPSVVSQVVGFHHQPQYATGDAKTLAAITYMGDLICRMKKIGFDGDRHIPALSSEAMAVLSFTRDDIKEVAGLLDKELDNAQDFLDMAS